ncbi:MAG: K+-sensing histidine kinase KdpD [Candidatus Azotimanducaceae bacterium]|jgi:K+-sensing histidine kinase KdpD
MDLQDQIAGIVHDVKNHLQLLTPSIELLITNESNGVQAAGHQISTTLAEVNHQLVLLLGLYRLEETSLFATEETFLADILETVCGRIPKGNIHIECDDELTVFCDARLVTAVIGDALHNASRYSQKQVNVTALPFECGVLLRVDDDGAGLADTNLSNHLAKAGTGLGMLLASKVAEAHRNGAQRGYVSLVESPELGGVRFELYLP